MDQYNIISDISIGKLKEKKKASYGIKKNYMYFKNYLLKAMESKLLNLLSDCNIIHKA